MAARPAVTGGGGGGGPTVYISHAFNGVANDPLVGSSGEVGPAWLSTGGNWQFDGAGTVVDKATSGHSIAYAEGTTNDFRLVCDMTFARGSLVGQWNGIAFLNTTGGIPQGLSIRPNGSSSSPDLKLFAGTSTVLTTWDISAVDLVSTGSRLTENDRAEIEVTYDPSTGIISCSLDGTLAGTYTLDATPSGERDTFGPGTYAGLYSNERVNPGDGVWHSFTYESRT